MRIGLVTGEYPPMQGGVGAFTQELAKALHALGHDIYIITSNEAKPENMTLTSRELRNPIDIGYAKILPQGRRWWWRDVALIADLAIRHELDLVNVQFQAAAFNMKNPAIYLLPWRMKGICPFVVTFHDLRVPYLFPKAGKLRQWVVKKMALSAENVITTNAADYTVNTKEWQVENVIEIPIGSNISVNPVEATAIAQLRSQLGVGDGLLLGYFGFLNESKGADLLVHSLANLGDEAHVVFIGGRTGASDPTNNAAFDSQLQTVIQQHNLSDRVHFTGFVDDVAVSTHLKACDAVVLPYRDGISLRRGTLMAALAHGCAVISTEPEMPAPALVHGENCYLVPANDADALTAAIRTVTTNPTLTATLEAGAALCASQFSWDKIAQQTVAFYETSHAHRS